MSLEPAVSRIGVTMREVQDQRTGEWRDALARDWSHFLSAALPEATWCPIPNLGETAVTLIERWDIRAICLTGGDDVGASPARDRTERALLQHCLDRGKPVLGVCRGLQLLWTQLGGALQEVEGHVNALHDIRYLDNPIGLSGTREVNSYHRWSLRGHVERLVPFAVAADGTIEAALARDERCLGVMWHPERGPEPHRHDVQLVRWLFGYRR
ncbi:MAG TPA: gamma-glutamyl-gamma-aminobutyrate hydrolase family protein [Burkholderiales bacterium]|nr:gamma-glutamyl-gamma-aminobutyrate hydrolase family protein [Burkholderiales bacterium]